MVELLAIYKASKVIPCKSLVKCQGSDTIFCEKLTAKSGVYIQIGDPTKTANELYAAKNENRAWTTPVQNPIEETLQKTSIHGFNIVRREGTIRISETFPLLEVVIACGFRLKRPLDFAKDFACVCGTKCGTEKSLMDHIVSGNKTPLRYEDCAFQNTSSWGFNKHRALHLDGQAHPQL
jgi:hypothetical protein